MLNKQFFIHGFILIPVLLIMLGACGIVPQDPSSASTSVGNPLQTAAEAISNSAACVECAQATLAAVQTQQQSDMDAQAAATAEVMRANAQATLDSVGATLSAAQTQQQNTANILAAQVAATAEIDRANARATLVAAGSTQNAAQTQDAIRQTQAQNDIQMTADLATREAGSTTTQQANNALAADTQTAVANLIATQTQSALSTAQTYADQARARAQNQQNQLGLVGLWCLLISIPVLVGVIIGIFMRWTKNRLNQQRIDLQSAQTPAAPETQPTPAAPARNDAPATIQTPDHVRQWLVEVHRKLQAEKKDDHDNPGV